MTQAHSHPQNSFLSYEDMHTSSRGKVTDTPASPPNKDLEMDFSLMLGHRKMLL